MTGWCETAPGSWHYWYGGRRIARLQRETVGQLIAWYDRPRKWRSWFVLYLPVDSTVREAQAMTEAAMGIGLEVQP